MLLCVLSHSGMRDSIYSDSKPFFSRTKQTEHKISDRNVGQNKIELLECGIDIQSTNYM